MADKAYGPGLMRKADKANGPNSVGLIRLMSLMVYG